MTNSRSRSSADRVAVVGDPDRHPVRSGPRPCRPGSAPRGRAGVYFTALPIRLLSSWRSREAIPRPRQHLHLHVHAGDAPEAWCSVATVWASTARSTAPMSRDSLPIDVGQQIPDQRHSAIRGRRIRRSRSPAVAGSKQPSPALARPAGVHADHRERRAKVVGGHGGEGLQVLVALTKPRQLRSVARRVQDALKVGAADRARSHPLTLPQLVLPTGMVLRPGHEFPNSARTSTPVCHRPSARAFDAELVGVPSHPVRQGCPGRRAVPQPAHQAHPREGAPRLGAGRADRPAGRRAHRAHRRHGGRDPRPPRRPPVAYAVDPDGPNRTGRFTSTGQSRPAGCGVLMSRARGQRLRDGDRARRAGARRSALRPLHELPLRCGHRADHRRGPRGEGPRSRSDRRTRRPGPGGRAAAQHRQGVSGRPQVLAVPLHEASLKTRAGGPVDDQPDIDAGFWAGQVPLRMVGLPGRAGPDGTRSRARQARRRPSWPRRRDPRPLRAQGPRRSWRWSSAPSTARSPTSTTPSTSRRTSTRRCATSCTSGPLVVAAARGRRGDRRRPRPQRCDRRPQGRPRHHPRRLLAVQPGEPRARLRLAPSPPPGRSGSGFRTSDPRQRRPV